MKSNLKTKGWANPISVSVMLLAIILSLALFALHRIELSIIFMVALGLLSVSMRIADQWEHAVVLRMGKFQGLKGPGVFFILPIIDSVSAYVDQRVRVSSFKAEQTLTKDTVPVNVDAVAVGIKDIAIPVDLAEAMSKEAQAERERRARVILGTAETEIAEKFAQASKEYRNNPVALHLRGMNMLFEGLKEKGSMVIVPSSALETMNLGAIGGLASLSKVQDDL